MLRKGLCALAVLGLSLGLVVAEEIKGAKIMRIDDKKVTVTTGSKKKNDVKTTDYDVAQDCKFSKLDKKNKVQLEGGLKNEVFQNINPKKGVQATVIVTEGKVTELVLKGKKKKKDAN